MIISKPRDFSRCTRLSSFFIDSFTTCDSLKTNSSSSLFINSKSLHSTAFSPTTWKLKGDLNLSALPWAPSQHWCFQAYPFHVSFFQFRSIKILQVSFSFLLLDFSNFFFRFLHFFPIFIHPLIYFSSWSYFILFFYISFTSFFLFSLSFSFSHSSPSSFVFFLLYFFFRQCLFIKAYMKFTQ